MANTYLSRTIGSPTHSNKGTLSWWQTGATDNTTQYILACESGQERLLWYMTSGRFQGGLRGSGGSPDIDFELSGTPRFRDPNAWYHCVLAWDSTQSTASDRIKFYVNNVQYTVTGNADIPQNHDMPMNKNGLPFRIGSTIGGGSYFVGVMSHMHFVDGTQYTPSTFGETDSTTGEWKIKEDPSGITYGNNGFWWLKNSNALTDSSPNSNTPTEGGAGLTKTESSPSNVFATLNSLVKSGYTITYSNGNTTATYPSSGWAGTLGSIGLSKGKWYWEGKMNTTGDNNFFGIMGENVWMGDTSVHNETTGVVIAKGSGNLNVNNTATASYFSALSNGDIFSCALDLDSATKTIQFYKNGVANGAAVNLPTNMQTGFVFPAFVGNASSASINHQVNFGNGFFGQTQVSSAGTNASGNGIFEYDVPSGFTAISTKGLNL